MPDIDMVQEGVPLGKTAESTVQQGGGGSIEMYGGDGVSLSMTPVSCVQSGKGNSGIDFVGDTSLLGSRTPTHPYGPIKHPSDRGE